MRANMRLLGPICWVLSIQYYIVQIVSATMWDQVSYSWTHNTISDLGNTACGAYGDRFVCSPLCLLMNASFIMLAITMSVGAVVIGRQYGSGRVGYGGFICMIVSGLGTALVGLFPENGISAAHIAGAALVFLAGNVAMILIGWKIHAFPVLLRTYAILSGLVGLGGLVLFMSHIYLGLGIGGMERIVAYPQSIFMIICGVFLCLRQPKNS